MPLPRLLLALVVLTVLAAWRLRKKRPEMKRPFQIPWGRAGLAYVVIAPMVMSVVALAGSDKFALKWGPVPVALGVIAYFVFPKIKAMVEA